MPERYALHFPRSLPVSRRYPSAGVDGFLLFAPSGGWSGNSMGGEAGEKHVEWDGKDKQGTEEGWNRKWRM